MTEEQIVRELVELGLQRGDVVFLHSSLSSLGRVEGGADSVIDAFLHVLGPEGTLLVPTFGSLGLITERLKQRPEAVESCHPRARVAAIGRDAAAICADHWKAETAHGENTPFARIAELGGYVCLLGVDQDRNTTLHTAEALLRLPYLKPTAEITFATPEGEQTKSWPCFPGPHRDFIGLDPVFRASGKMAMGRIGSAVVRLIRGRDLIDISLELGKKDPAFVLCDNPNCADCVAQRAALRNARFGRETFLLASSAALAGRYVPEIVENMAAAGVTAVELDYLHGLPLNRLAEDVLSEAIEELRSNALRVVSLRLNTGTAKAGKLVELAAAKGISRVVMPLGRDARRIAESCKARGVVLSFANVAVSGEQASAGLLELKTAGAGVGFTFNAANFARAGENPFLASYKTKLRRFVDQLDVEDALFDGTPAPLARGNAEIKEMISILRCADFSGTFVLGAGNRAVGDLRKTVERLEELLRTM